MTHVDWKLYPKDMPNSGESYLVTVEDEHGFRYVGTAVYMNLTGWLVDKRYKVIAWAEKPEPYRPSEPEDNHPDAITARKYMKKDPETVKALHIFDE